jgi:hypothetical protein
MLRINRSAIMPGPIQPPIQWVPGALSPGVKWQVREADRSLPASAEVKKTWVYTSTPPYVFIAQCLISYALQLYLFFFYRGAVSQILRSIV